MGQPVPKERRAKGGPARQRRTGHSDTLKQNSQESPATPEHVISSTQTEVTTDTVSLVNSSGSNVEPPLLSEVVIVPDHERWCAP
jgi:hypothetical protein